MYSIRTANLLHQWNSMASAQIISRSAPSACSCALFMQHALTLFVMTLGGLNGLHEKQTMYRTHV